MFWLSTSTVVRPRDQLLAAGQRASVAAPPDPPADADLLEELGPICEAMYLMMSTTASRAFGPSSSLRFEAWAMSSSKSSPSRTLPERLWSAPLETWRSSLETSPSAVDELRDDPSRAEVAFVLDAVEKDLGSTEHPEVDG